MKHLLLFLSMAALAFAQATINAPAVQMDADGAASVRLWMTTQGTGTQTQLAAPVGAADTTIQVVSGQGIQPNSVIGIGAEHILVVSRERNTLTVTRGQNGSTAAAYSAGANVTEMKYRTFAALGRQIIVETLRQIVRIAEIQQAQAAAQAAADSKAQASVQ